jgi:ribosomal protein S18 acetylase RimI-like enzyme
MNDSIITQVTYLEIEKLQKISIETFSETFGDQNSKDDLEKYIKENLSIKKLSNELNNPNSEFYFYQFNNQAVGYLKVNFKEAQTEIKDSSSLEIERIYVLNKFQGQKIGHLLLEFAIERAKNENLTSVWLGVWEENKKAISFYQKHNFIQFDKHVFKLGNDLQTDILMKLPLNQID